MGSTAAAETLSSLWIVGITILGISFAMFMWSRISFPLSVGLYETGPRGLNVALLEEGAAPSASEETLQKVAAIQDAISEGATSFLQTEYRYLTGFVIAFSLLLFFLLSGGEFSAKWLPNPDPTKTDKQDQIAPPLYLGIFTAIAFLAGAGTSVLCGYLGMMLATFANARVALSARRGIDQAFTVAFRAGSVMGFLLTSFGVLNLFILLALYHWVYGRDWLGIYEAITGYGLGGSTIALFGRVGGGIYTKAADVGADLVGKVERGIPEDDPRNPAVIADNVGDNVGDIAGMGADLFGSLAEGTCAALVVASLSSLGLNRDWTAMSYPLLISTSGVLICLLVTFLATDIAPAQTIKQVEPTIKNQLIWSTILMTPTIWFVSKWALPHSFIGVFTADPALPVFSWQCFVCVATGLWGGLVIGLMTEYWTSNRFYPVQELADSSRTGPATLVIFGMSLGYYSAVIPAIVISIAIAVGFSYADMFGIALAALGMLSTLATGLTIDAFGPISDNAGGIAEMAELGRETRERTDALDAAGNTTAAIGKGFAIGSAALVSLSLFGAYVKRAELDLANTSVLDPRIFSGLLIGAMLPYWFSAMTVKSVGKAALKMVEEVRRQFQVIPGLIEGRARPDYARCVEISTQASLTEMVGPGLLVMGTPLVVGILFGTKALAGVLSGSLVSGVLMAVSMANTGGAWDNAKKYVEAGATEHARSLGGKGSDCHKATVVGDTIGDPLKDTSGPSLNILIKLSAVESLVLAPFFLKYTADGLFYKLLDIIFHHAKH